MSTEADTMANKHIALIDFPSFYAEVFPDPDSAKDFYAKVSSLPPAQNAPMIVLHQTARMVWLADQVDEFARGRPAFQVLFYLIAAELVAKLTFGFKGEGESRKFVRKFFAEICDDEARSKLSSSFSRLPYGSVTSEEVVNVLYDIRCDVVHKGMYYAFHLPDERDDTPQMVHIGDRGYIAGLTVRELRRMVVTGAVLASQNLLTKIIGGAGQSPVSAGPSTPAGLI